MYEGKTLMKTLMTPEIVVGDMVVEYIPPAEGEFFGSVRCLACSGYSKCGEKPYVFAEYETVPIVTWKIKECEEEGGVFKKGLWTVISRKTEECTKDELVEKYKALLPHTYSIISPGSVPGIRGGRAVVSKLRTIKEITEWINS